MQNNKLKIHIGSGNIYYGNTDTNESIYSFLQAQEDETKKFIDFEFIYDDTYQNYFDEFLLKLNLKNNDRLDVLTNKNSKFLFYHFNDYLTRMNVPTKPVTHTSASNDHLAIEIIQRQNWQYFIERILEACQSNNIGDNIDCSNVKEFKDIKNSVQNITICKQFYEHTYNEIAQYFSDMIRQLPPNELDEIDRDLILTLSRPRPYFIDLKSNVNDLGILNTFCEFFHRYGRFPGSQKMIIIPKPAIPEFIKTDEVISPTQLFEKFKASDARGLVSPQALAALALFSVDDIITTTEAASETLTEFLHNMSYQALKNGNDDILLEFDWLTELKIEIINRCLDNNLGSLKINQKNEETI